MALAPVSMEYAIQKQESRRRPALEGSDCEAAVIAAASPYGPLQRLDVRRRRALLPLRHVERDLLAFFQRFVARSLDRAVMGKQILPAVIRRDEPETLGVVEPLHGTCSHVISIP